MDDRVLKLVRTDFIWQRWDMLMRQYPESLSDQLKLTTELAIAMTTLAANYKEELLERARNQIHPNITPEENSDD